MKCWKCKANTMPNWNYCKMCGSLNLKTDKERALARYEHQVEVAHTLALLLNEVSEEKRLDLLKAMTR